MSIYILKKINKMQVAGQNFWLVYILKSKSSFTLLTTEYIFTICLIGGGGHLGTHWWYEWRYWWTYRRIKGLRGDVTSRYGILLP